MDKKDMSRFLKEMNEEGLGNYKFAHVLRLAVRFQEGDIAFIRDDEEQDDKQEAKLKQVRIAYPFIKRFPLLQEEEDYGEEYGECIFYSCFVDGKVIDIRSCSIFKSVVEYLEWRELQFEEEGVVFPDSVTIKTFKDGE